MFLSFNIFLGRKAVIMVMEKEEERGKDNKRIGEKGKKIRKKVFYFIKNEFLKD